MKNLIIIALVIGLAAPAAACSASHETGGATATTPAAAAPATQGGASKDEIPAAVRHAFANAQSITKQHKDLTAAQIASIEKQSGMKVADKDHHSFLAFATEGGKRKQIGAATIVNAQGRELVVVYASESGSPVINEAHGEGSGLPQAFLDQFKNKGHDSKLRLGEDIKPQGANAALARAATDAIRLDVVTMQALYGASHTH